MSASQSARYRRWPSDSPPSRASELQTVNARGGANGLAKPADDRWSTELAAADDRIVVLSGDICNRLFDAFKEQHPARFYNCGVAEANMTGMAAGFANGADVLPVRVEHLDG